MDGEDRGRNGERSAKAIPDAPERRVERPTIGLALGGGGARGFAHIGVLRTLLAHGIVPDVNVGTSTGAAAGGGAAARGCARLGVLRPSPARGFFPDVVGAAWTAPGVGACHAGGRLDVIED